MLEVKDLEEAKQIKDCRHFLEKLSKDLQDRYGLTEFEGIRMYGLSFKKGDLAIMVGFEYLSDKLMVAIKQKGYKVGFTEKDVVGNLSIPQVYNLLDKRLGKC